MPDISKLSQYDLYFFVEGAAEAIGKQDAVLDPMMAPVHEAGWAARIGSKAAAYRTAVEVYIRETTETTAAVWTMELLSQNVSQWRELATGLARQAPPARQSVLLQVAGVGSGRARRPKELKDLLLTLKGRMEVHGTAFKSLGMAPELVELPARVLARLEAGASDVAREKAEDSLARANVLELYGQLVVLVEAAWRAAELVSLQALLLVGRDDATPAEVAQQKERAAQAGALTVHLTRILGEARVEARKRAATEVLPPGLVSSDTPLVEAEQPAA